MTANEQESQHFTQGNLFWKHTELRNWPTPSEKVLPLEMRSHNALYLYETLWQENYCGILYMIVKQRLFFSVFFPCPTKWSQITEFAHKHWVTGYSLPHPPCAASCFEMHYMSGLEHGQKSGVTCVQLLSDLLVKLNQAQMPFPQS